VPQKKKNIKPRGVTLYNKILKEFTKVNNSLPEERKLSLSDRRKYIKEKIYPQFKGTASTRVSVKDINKEIVGVLDTIVPKEGCDVNFISPSIVANVGWFELDDFIRDVLPACIYISIDAGDFGKTKIFNTLNYNYTKNGVKKIVDNIRDFVNNDSGVDVTFTGEKRLRKGKTNDGTPENYYIEFILVVNSEPIKDINPILFNVPKSQKKQVTTVKNAILSRVKELGNKKKRRKRARRTAIKNISNVRKLAKRQVNAKTVDYKRKLAYKKIKEYNRAIKQIQNAYNKGNLTEDQYNRFINEINQLIIQVKKEGGIID
jgi:hypothetical protein